MKMDVHYESATYTRISSDRATSLDDKIVKGIDGIYENASPPPKCVIAEAKYSTSRLSKTNDGKQMSEKWILGSDRLENAVGPEIAQKIQDELILNPDNVQKILVKIDKKRNVVETLLDAAGKKIKE
ncbi:cytosolic protein [Listeria booriae]|uniref:Cytosolic protein n=1 Tax=Listeria booriae TaxID=1552123 RepID=A0A842G2D5_9LIST|nr:cytosolic protein [Listeria booriae]MBC2283906.1 cytosolic protein [Listeria booriae]MBC2293332.1 cytosolic protein [Listeria booriae]